jgi:hypothetical protein
MLLMAACGGGSDGPDGGGPGNNPGGTRRPGIGASTEAPEGTPFSPPAGLTVVQPIAGYDGQCASDDEARGTGLTVRLCFTLINTSAQAQTLSMPAGLVFVAQQNVVQNGMLLQPESITVPAGQTLTVPLFLYSINLSRNVSAPEDTFSLGPITQDTALREVLQLVANKDLSEPLDAASVQNAVWHVTDGDGLTANDRSTISAIPNR